MSVVQQKEKLYESFHRDKVALGFSMLSFIARGPWDWSRSRTRT